MAKAVYSNAQVIDQLDSGYHWTTLDLTFSFPSTATWFPYAEKSGFTGFGTAQQAAARQALSLWDDLILNDFREVSGVGNITYQNTTSNIGYAHAYYPGGYTGSGSVWMNNSYGAGSGTNNLVTPVVGDWGFQTFIHETGHALGLDHPGNYNGGSPTYANDALFYQDSQQYTIMSYFTADNTGCDWYASDGRWYYPQTPMLYDVLAIQAIYGAETTTRTGNTTYGFNATGDVPSIFNFASNKHPVLCIYDSAGIDTLDLSGWNTASRIDLAPGAFSDCDMMTKNISIAFSAMIENARGGGGADTVAGNAVANLLQGLVGNDQIAGLAGNDTLDGGDGNDQLNGGAGNDSLIGGLGSDTAVYAGLRANYTVTYNATLATFTVVDVASGYGEGTDTLAGLEFLKFLDVLLDLATLVTTTTTRIAAATEGADTLTGTNGAETIAALGGNDIITALGGDDWLDGGAGLDSLYGGQGNDTYVVDVAGDRVFENLNEGTDTVRSLLSYALGANVENLVLLGTGAINGTGNELANVLTGNDGSNVLNGGLGADTMRGGLGNDTYYVDNAGDQVVELANGGIDSVFASISTVLSAEVETLTLTGNAGINGTGNGLANTLVGNTGSNVLDGGAGADTMAGGLGNDTYFVDNAGDVVTESAGQGTDTVYSTVSWSLAADVENLSLSGAAAINGTGNALNNVMIGNAAANVIDGGAGADSISGNGGNDMLRGGIGNDMLDGGEGKDTIVGGAGQDTMSGGAGADVFLFSFATDTPAGAINRDTILDFTSGVDRINLADIDANPMTAGVNDAFAFIGQAAFGGVAGQARAIAGLVQLDLNGDRIADAEIVLANKALLGVGDFVL